MLYSFDIKYNVGLFNGMYDATIIMKLPQSNLDDVKRNPFVIDIVNHPNISAGIKVVQNHCNNLVDNIREYKTAMPNSINEITCRYQEQAGCWNYKTFSFKIYVDAPSGCWPLNQLDFICKPDYDIYEKMYHGGQYVIAPFLPNTFADIAVGYYYEIGSIATVDMVRIVNVVNSQSIQAETVDANGTVNTIVIDILTRSRLSYIRLNDEMLSMIGFRYTKGNIYNLTNADYFEGVLTNQRNAQFQVYIHRGRVGYSLIVADPNNNDGYRLLPFFFLHELQYLLMTEYNANITLSYQKMSDISRYLNEVILGERIMSNLPLFINSLIGQNNGQTLSMQQIVNKVVNHFGINELIAKHYLTTMHLYN